MRQFWDIFLFGSLLINSSRRSQKRAHSHCVYNICFIRGDVCDGLRLRIPWIAEISDAIYLGDAYEMRSIASLQGIPPSARRLTNQGFNMDD
ncbi:hypothetical protein [uncultured Nostoc sp.]|uniref:hypothetical protein n=1 Tax=uncultured Nostoc sp. TaxID=340711 RepID=UPI002603EB47|nr:hypothetical protein [uncultured Nostoc sp.]